MARKNLPSLMWHHFGTSLAHVAKYNGKLLLSGDDCAPGTAVVLSFGVGIQYEVTAN